MQGIAIRIRGADRDFNHGALVEDHILDIPDFRGAVGVFHYYRDQRGHGRRNTGAIAVVGGLDLYLPGSGLDIGGRPDQFQGVGVKHRSGRQSGHFIGSGSGQPAGQGLRRRTRYPQSQMQKNEAFATG